MIYCVILAAGKSSRMGQPKALLQWQGRSFIAHIAEAAQKGGCGGVWTVLGPPDETLIRRALPQGIGATHNPRPELGMLSSVQAGVVALPPNTSSVLIWPVDVPLVKPVTVRTILDAAPGKLVIPQYLDGKKLRGGHPIRIPRSRFGDLQALDPARGLKGLIEARSDEVIRIVVEDRGVIEDVDTPSDLERLQKTVPR